MLVEEAGPSIRSGPFSVTFCKGFLEMDGIRGVQTKYDEACSCTLKTILCSTTKESAICNNPLYLL